MNNEFQAVKDLLAPAEAPKAEQPADTQPAEPVQEPIIEEATDDVIDAPEVTEELVAEQVDDVQDDVQSESGEPEYADEVQTIAQLAKAIDVEPDYLYKIKIGMGSDQEAIPIGQLKDEYQTQLHNNTKLQAQLDEQASQLESAQGGYQQREQISEQGRVLALEGAKLNDQYNEIDWEKFERESPGEASLAKQKFSEAHNNLMNKAREVEQYEMQTSQRVLQESANRLMEMIPEWKDESTRAAEQRQVADLLVGAGYPMDYVGNLADPIAIKLVRELVQLRGEKARANESMSKVQKAPRVLKNRGQFAKKPGADFKKARDLARQTGDKHAELAAVKMILEGKG